jgi:response regulator NasT
LDYLVVGEVGDGRSAVNLARELKPDVVIMDIKMPDMDGIDAAKTLTEERIAPVILLTAYSQKDLVERAKEARSRWRWPVLRNSRRCTRK